VAARLAAGAAALFSATAGGNVAVVHGTDVGQAINSGVIRPMPKIVGTGTSNVSTIPILSDRFDDVVAVGRDHQFFCTGILIDPSAVLTAKHCLPVNEVLFGLDISKPSDVIDVSASYPAEDDQDAAILKLARAAQPAVRARRGQADSAPPLGTARLIGFGANEPSGHLGFGVKRFADVGMQGWGCDARRAAVIGCAPLDELVLSSPGGRDTCNGDSGGPVVERYRNTWRLLAITSRPVRNSTVACGAGGVYERVDRLQPFIDKVLKQTDANQGAAQ
jgi:secreted trypsin-like serine protease